MAMPHLRHFQKKSGKESGCGGGKMKIWHFGCCMEDTRARNPKEFQDDMLLQCIYVMGSVGDNLVSINECGHACSLIRIEKLCCVCDGRVDARRYSSGCEVCRIRYSVGRRQ